MNSILKNYRKAVLSFVFLFYLLQTITAAGIDPAADGINPTSSQAEAIKFIDQVKTVPASALWPNVKPASLLENISINIHQPLSMYAGRGTNFCGYGAFAYLLLQDDPLGYAKFMLALYKDGKATMGRVNFTPSEKVRKASGALKYKGLLDIRPSAVGTPPEDQVVERLGRSVSPFERLQGALHLGRDLQELVVVGKKSDLAARPGQEHEPSCERWPEHGMEQAWRHQVRAGVVEAQDSVPLAVGAVAPEFVLDGGTMAGSLGKPFRLSEYRDQTVVIAFFYKARTSG